MIYKEPNAIIPSCKLQYVRLRWSLVLIRQSFEWYMAKESLLERRCQKDNVLWCDWITCSKYGHHCRLNSRWPIWSIKEKTNLKMPSHTFCISTPILTLEMTISFVIRKLGRNRQNLHSNRFRSPKFDCWIGSAHYQATYSAATSQNPHYQLPNQSTWIWRFQQPSLRVKDFQYYGYGENFVQVTLRIRYGSVEEEKPLPILTYTFKWSRGQPYTYM